MIEAVKTIKNAPMGTNFKDVTKSALYGLASLIAFTIKLTVRIISSIVAMLKTLVGK